MKTFQKVFSFGTFLFCRVGLCVRLDVVDFQLLIFVSHNGERRYI